MGRLSLTDVPMTHAFGDRSLRGQRRGRRPIPVLKPSRIEELEKVGRDGEGASVSPNSFRHFSISLSVQSGND